MTKHNGVIYIYLIRCANGAFYTGITNDPVRRFREHRNGTGAVYTHTYRALDMRVIFKTPSRSFAMRLERKIKALPHAFKQKLFEKLGSEVDFEK